MGNERLSIMCRIMHRPNSDSDNHATHAQDEEVVNVNIHNI